jgi:hypothetical protein
MLVRVTLVKRTEEVKKQGKQSNNGLPGICGPVADGETPVSGDAEGPTGTPKAAYVKILC